MLKHAILLIMLLTFTSWVEIEDNQLSSSHYLDNRLETRDKRYATMLRALRLMKSRNVKIIVETGTARDGVQNFQGDGGSTIIFGDWASKHHALFYSVDISPKAVKNAQETTRAYGYDVQVICEDSIKFLNEFNQPIDFLYLDSYDYDFKNPTPSQDHHLKEIIAAYPKLHENSVVMIDDCDLPNGGKGLLVINYLLKRGWKIDMKGYQVILTRNEISK